MTEHCKLFGYDYLQAVRDLPGNKGKFEESMSEEEEAYYRERTDFWKSRNYYWMVPELSTAIWLDAKPREEGQLVSVSRHALYYIDENTIEYSDDRIYKYAG